jgi:hypothetical protein
VAGTNRWIAVRLKKHYAHRAMRHFSQRIMYANDPLLPLTIVGFAASEPALGALTHGLLQTELSASVNL